MCILDLKFVVKLMVNVDLVPANADRYYLEVPTLTIAEGSGTGT